MADGTADGNLEGFLLGSSLGSVDVLGLGNNEDNKLGFPDGSVLGTELDTCECTELGSLECSTDGTADGNLEVFFIEAWLGSLVGIDLSNNEGTKLGFWGGKILGTEIG